MIIEHYRALKPLRNHYFYSPSTKLFYLPTNYHDLPNDYVFVDEEEMQKIISENKKQAR